MPPECFRKALEYLFVADVALEWNSTGRPSHVTAAHALSAVCKPPSPLPVRLKEPEESGRLLSVYLQANMLFLTTLWCAMNPVSPE